VAKNDITVKILGDASQLRRELDGADGKLSGFGGKASTALKVGAAALAGAGLGAVVVGKQLVDSASDLAETQSKVGVIFGDSAGPILEFAKTADKALGQSQTAALSAAAQFATFGKAANLTGGDLVNFSTDLTTLASDVASFNNVDPGEAAEALGAALRGEAEPMRRFGVLLDDATLKAEAMELRIYDGNGALTQQQKILAANRAIFEQTTDAQGDFARTSDGVANKSRIVAAQFENMKAQLGEKLMPVAAAFFSFLSEQGIPAIQKLAAWMEENLGPAIQRVAAWFQENWPQIRAAIANVVDWLVNEGWPILQRVFQAVSEKVGELVAIFKKHWGEISTTVSSTIGAVQKVIEVAVAVISGIWDKFGENIMKQIETTWNFVKGIVEAAMSVIRGIIQTVTALIRGDWSGAWDGIKSIIPGVWRAIESIVSYALDTVRNIISAAWTGIRTAVSEIFNGIRNLAGNAWDAVVNGVRDLPGRILAYVGNMVSAGASLGRGLVDGMKDAIGALAGAGAGLARNIANTVTGFINRNIIDKLNDLFEFKIDGPFGTSITFNPPDIGHLPSFHSGGVVPGRVGQEVPILAQAGERVLTREQQKGMMSGMYVENLYAGTTVAETIEALERTAWLGAAA
jgi:hypothetical protein